MATGAELAVRRAVRDSLAGFDPQSLVLVACSGGADSLALAAAVAHVAPRTGLRAGAVVVDHGVQDGSAEVARATSQSLSDLGLDPVEVVHVVVRPRHEGPEGAARRSRYAALDAAADRHRAAAVLLGHTLDDQAETVLLGLARGSGARSLSGMAPVSGRYRRPMLGLNRADVREAVPAGMKPWEDPHNADPAYARSRARHRALPALEAELGPGIPAALARTAALLRSDADALDAWAERVLSEARCDDMAAGSVALDILAALPEAVRTRVIRRAAIEAGSPATDLSAAHVWAVDDLVIRWRGQRGIDLPGPVRATRSGSVITFRSGR